VRGGRFALALRSVLRYGMLVDKSSLLAYCSLSEGGHPLTFLFDAGHVLQGSSNTGSGKKCQWGLRRGL
jgi:hypothetical protein